MLTLSALNLPLATAHAQGTAFTYQGQLQNNGSPANGTYDIRAGLFTTNSGGTVFGEPVTNLAVVISNGLFTIPLDFGNVFDGTIFWLQISVRTNGASSFTILSPRQQLTPAPYAEFATTASNLSGTVSSGGLAGTYGGAMTLNNFANQFSGAFAGNGGSLSNLNASQLTSGTVADARLPVDVAHTNQVWLLSGNTGVATGSNYLGNNDNQYLDLHANGIRALRLRVQTDTLGLFTNAPNVIGGSSVNLTAIGVVGATIAGGGGNDQTGNTYANTVNADFGTVAGGIGNSTSGLYSTIGGGTMNSNTASYGTLGGGEFNSVTAGDATLGGGSGNLTDGAYSFLGGGQQNSANSEYGTVAGGYQNSVNAPGAFVGGGGGDGYYNDGNTAGGPAAFIGGGVGNSNDGSYGSLGGGLFNQVTGTNATVAGGAENIAAGRGSFIGGGGYDGTILAGNSVQSDGATIGGGLGNSIPFGAHGSFIGGGYGNTASSFFATVGGGSNNLASGYAATLGGGYGNAAGGHGSFIGGGGYDGTIIAGNTVQSDGATIGGGLGNSIPFGAHGSFIGGGYGNTASNFFAAVGGGSNNVASGYAAAVGGGLYNTAGGNYSAVAGGDFNFASGVVAFVGGGSGNNATANSATVSGGAGNFALGINSTVPGGGENTAQGAGSFAAGTEATANYTGSFVWSDDSGSAGTSDTAQNQFVARASGGFYFYTGIGSSGAQLDAGDTSWKALSDRNVKKNFKPVDTEAVLNKLAAVPIEQWNYKWENDSDVPNIGPMAQDFIAAFYPGRDEKGITTLEFDGVELAAIQGLNRKLQEDLDRQNSENARLQQQNEALARRLDELEAAIKSLAERK